MDDQSTLNGNDLNSYATNEDAEQGIKQNQLNKEDISTDPQNPKNWSNLKKWGNFAIVFINAFTGYFSSSIYMPAVHDLMDYFGTDLTVMNATIALYILAMAIAPLFWAPFSERIGRRPVYIMSMALYIVATIICGIANNLALFFVFRIIQGASASAGLTVGGGSVADMFKPHQRGRAMSIFTLGTILGPTFAPLIGGYVGQYLGWRWIFYISTMIGGVILTANVFIMRESLYRPNSSQEKKSKTLKERIADLKFDPFKGFLLLLRPDILLMAIPMSVSFGWFLFLVSEVSPTYSGIYHLDQGSVGLLYITGGLGSAFGALSAGVVTDKFYMYLRSKAEDGVVQPEKRLPPVFFGVPLIVAGNLMYGWFLHARFHWFVPLTGYLIMSMGTLFTVVVSTNFLVETYLQSAASVTAIVSCTRNLAATIFTLAGAAVRAGLGDGWAYTLSALISLFFFATFIPCVIIYGERMRNAKPWWSRSN